LASFELRDDRCSWWELKYIYNFYLNNYMFICFLFLHRFAITIWKNIKRKKNCLFLELKFYLIFCFNNIK
jgi:hypothetical protein